MALSCIIFETKRDIGRKSWFFHIPPAFDAPVKAMMMMMMMTMVMVSPLEYCH